MFYQKHDGDRPMTKVFVHQGQWRNQTIENMEFDLISNGIMSGRNGDYVTVKGDPVGSNTDTIRIYINKKSDVNIMGNISSDDEDDDTNEEVTNHVIPMDGEYNGETEDDAIDRINTRFEVLEEMTEAAAQSLIRGMIVSGAPGTGKSFGVEKTLHMNALNSFLTDGRIPYEIIRGNITAIGLYKKLHEFCNEGDVLVFDDSDAVFFDPISLSLLKVALDTSSKRTISWNSNSYDLVERGIPNSFQFEGSVIFITNMDLENTKSKQLKPHFDALISRSHYLDLTIKTNRDKYLRIKGLVKKNNMLTNHGVSENTSQEILDYIKENVSNLRELSLRTTLKIADVAKMKPNGWKKLCDMTVCK
jgi:hypothetical protein